MKAKPPDTCLHCTTFVRRTCVQCGQPACIDHGSYVGSHWVCARCDRTLNEPAPVGVVWAERKP